jgi:hypothetical protein
LHTESELHDIEHPAVQCTVQVEPPLQLTLPLGPTVRSQSDIPEQLTLHDAPHEPLHALLSVHASEQLDPLQPELPMSHDVPAGHEHELPAHTGGGGVSLPQANTITSSNDDRANR